ncbi:hypothetical protein B0H19DRAFT_1265241 [Mycena capillaripes]|nr:hypothetical protein B0H19DRAFT_1265241 [Mycena capillaripes]
MSSIDVYFFISRWAHPLVSAPQIHCFSITWLGMMFSYLALGKTFVVQASKLMLFEMV